MQQKFKYICKKFIENLFWFLSCLLILAACADRNVQNGAQPPQKHVMFVIGGGSHIHPTFEMVKGLIAENAKVTYVVWHEKTHPDFIKLQKLGANVLCLGEELYKINPKLTEEQINILKKPVDNFVEQPGNDFQDPAICNHYFMAKLWDELLTLAKNLNPDVVVYDNWLGYWGKYVARALDVPAYLSMPIAFLKEWGQPSFINGCREHHQKKYPATQKRIWAANCLKQKLGAIAGDIDVDHLWAFPNQDEAMFVYTYPKLEGYQGTNSLGTKIIFAGYADSAKDLNPDEKRIFDAVTKFKGNKKLVLVSMGGEASKPLEFFKVLGEALGNGGANRLKNQNIVVAVHPGRKVMQGERYDAKTVQEFMKSQGHTNFIVYDYFPLPELFKIADVFIGHGGANSSLQALKSHKPIVLMPCFGDQPTMSKKLAARDLAITIPDALNVMACKDDARKWTAFTSNPMLRSQWVNWVRQVVDSSLKQSLEDRRQKIDALLQGEDGYGAIVDMLLQAKKPKAVAINK